MGPSGTIWGHLKRSEADLKPPGTNWDHPGPTGSPASQPSRPFHKNSHSTREVSTKKIRSNSRIVFRDRKRGRTAGARSKFRSKHALPPQRNHRFRKKTPPKLQEAAKCETFLKSEPWIGGRLDFGRRRRKSEPEGRHAAARSKVFPKKCTTQGPGAGARIISR